MKKSMLYRLLDKDKALYQSNYHIKDEICWKLWATEMEIQAASDLIGVDVFTYSQEKWLKYSSSNVCPNRHSFEQTALFETCLIAVIIEVVYV